MASQPLAAIHNTIRPRLVSPPGGSVRCHISLLNHYFSTKNLHIHLEVVSRFLKKFAVRDQFTLWKMKLLELVKKVLPNIPNLEDEKNLEHSKLPVLVDMKTTDVILKVKTDSKNSYLIIIFQGKFIFQNTQWVAEQNIESAMHIQRQILTPCRNWLVQRFHQNQLPMHTVWLLDEVLAHLIKIWPVLLVLLGKYFLNLNFKSWSFQGYWVGWK